MGLNPMWQVHNFLHSKSWLLKPQPVDLQVDTSTRPQPVDLQADTSTSPQPVDFQVNTSTNKPSVRLTSIPQTLFRCLLMVVLHQQASEQRIGLKNSINRHLNNVPVRVAVAGLLGVVTFWIDVDVNMLKNVPFFALRDVSTSLTWLCLVCLTWYCLYCVTMHVLVPCPHVKPDTQAQVPRVQQGV